MSKDKLVPKLRFKEFYDSGSWLRKKLGNEVYSIIAGGDIDRKKVTDNGAYPILANALVNDGIIGYYENHYTVKGPAVTVTGRGDIGHAKAREFNFTPVVRLLTIKSKHDSIFLENSINNYKSSFESTGVPQLTVPKLSAYELNFPRDIQEEKKIGIFFKKIDQMIQLQQSKVNKAKDIKSAYLTEMFPKEGEKYPKKRFKGFTKEWKFKALEELTETFTDGDWIESRDQSHSGVRLIQTGNIGVTKFLEKPKNKKWISESTFTKLNCKEIFPGDILISRLPEPAGRATIVPKLNTRMITAVDCTIVRSSSEYSSDFLIQYLSTSNYFNKITAELAGGTRQRISRSNLAEIKVPVPETLEEQEKVGMFFKNLDKHISIEEEKLGKLEKLKQAYLNDMFV